MLQGTTERITVRSDPKEVTATLSDGQTKVTPFAITIPRNRDVQFHFSKAGYQSVDITDPSQVEGGYLVIDYLLLIFPIFVDEGSGAYFEHQRSDVYIHLEPISERPRGEETQK